MLQSFHTDVLKMELKLYSEPPSPSLFSLPVANFKIIKFFNQTILRLTLVLFYF